MARECKQEKFPSVVSRTGTSVYLNQSSSYSSDGQQLLHPSRMYICISREVVWFTIRYLVGYAFVPLQEVIMSSHRTYSHTWFNFNTGRHTSCVVLMLLAFGV
jgi:hypothetical protein